MPKPARQTCLFGRLAVSSGRVTRAGADIILSRDGRWRCRGPSFNEIPRRIQSRAIESGDPSGTGGELPVATMRSAPARRRRSRRCVSVDRALVFESSGWFHPALRPRAAFEDIVDFCLRSLKQGACPAWIHPLPMWHFLERQPPVRAEPSKRWRDPQRLAAAPAVEQHDRAGFACTLTRSMFNPVLTGPASSGPPVLSQSDAALVAAG